MEDTILGTTTLESMPPEFRGDTPKKNPWLKIIILILIVGTGAYWFINHNRRPGPDPNPQALSPIETSSTTSKPDDMGDLQATVNLAIPDFSNNF